MLGIPCRHCAFCVDDALMFVEYRAEEPAREAAALEAEMAEHSRRSAEMRGRR